jgi:Lon protease-like protein
LLRLREVRWGATLTTGAQVLNIFEPRYRAMYNDILFNGSRQFVVAVAADDPTEHSFSSVGVVFYLEDLKEVSGQTDDRIKYVVSHKVRAAAPHPIWLKAVTTFLKPPHVHAPP